MGHLPTRTINKKMAEFTTALAARAMLDSNLNLALNKEMDKIQIALGNAISAGRCHFDLKEVSDQAKVRLKESGYKLEYYNNSDPRDNTSDTFYRVSY